MVKFLTGAAVFGNLHIHARQVFAFAWIVGTPLAGLLADDKRPLVCIWDGEERIAAGGNVLAADGDAVFVGDIASFAPVRHTLPKGTSPPKILRPLSRGLE